MPRDFFEITETVECLKCGNIIVFDPDNDTIICDECDAILFVDYDSDKKGFVACLV